MSWNDAAEMKLSVSSEAFVMPSTTDQWGLVVNEAMASGLPVLVSTGCGCAADLVEEGVNGFAFDPTSVKELAGLLARLCLATPDRRAAMGAASRQRISAWSPQTFADSALSLAEAALQETPRRMRMLDRLLTTVVAKQQMKAAGA